MINNLFEFYNNELTFYSQVTKENKTISNLILIIGIISFILFWYFFISQNQYLWAICGIIVFAIMFYILIWLNGKTIKRKFPEMYISPLKWNSNKFNELFIKKISARIKNETEQNLDLIQKQIKENAEKEKTSSVIIFTTFGALFIPLWSTYIAGLMGIFKEDLKFLTINFIVITLLILTLSFFSHSLIELRDNLLTNHKKWNGLNDLITEYRIRKNVG